MTTVRAVRQLATSTVTPYQGIEVATVTTGTMAASQLTTMEATVSVWFSS